MKFYVSKCHDTLNGRPYHPETITPNICLNPYYNTTLKKEIDVKYILDSGAFQDVGKDERLSFSDALERQLHFEKKVGVQANAIVSYDHLVDEQLNETGQFKKRVDYETGQVYVDETIEAAKFLVKNRKNLGSRKLILSCQGTNKEQYIDCIESILKIAKPQDYIGFGGFCILSKSVDYEKEYYEIITEAFPKIHEAGIKHVHIFGMGVFRALVQTDIYARMNDIMCSYDTSSPEINSVFGKSFNPLNAQMNAVFSKIHKGNGYYSADLAIMNISLIIDYWKKMKTMPLPESFTPGLISRSKRPN
jgi:hypothetical protein